MKPFPFNKGTNDCGILPGRAKICLLVYNEKNLETNPWLKNCNKLEVSVRNRQQDSKYITAEQKTANVGIELGIALSSKGLPLVKR